MTSETGIFYDGSSFDYVGFRAKKYASTPESDSPNNPNSLIQKPRGRQRLGYPKAILGLILVSSVGFLGADHLLNKFIPSNHLTTPQTVVTVVKSPEIHTPPTVTLTPEPQPKSHADTELGTDVMPPGSTAIRFLASHSIDPVAGILPLVQANSQSFMEAATQVGDVRAEMALAQIAKDRGQLDPQQKEPDFTLLTQAAHWIRAGQILKIPNLPESVRIAVKIP